MEHGWNTDFLDEEEKASSPRPSPPEEAREKKGIRLY
jgi:hypothetical protein